MALKTIIFHIDQVQTHTQRLQLLAELEDALQQPHPVSERKYLKTLLYHSDWYIRREVALLVDRYGIPLNEDEQFQFAYALQNFAYLRTHFHLPTARQLLFEACRDQNPRIRSKAAAHLTPEDCQTPEEEAVYLYAIGDYLALVELGCTSEGRSPVVEVLQQGLRQLENTNYHRRQCAFALEQLEAIEDAQAEIQNLLASTTESLPQPENGNLFPNIPPHTPPLERLLLLLRQQGIWLDGRKVYPEIQVGTVTGRVTYKNPPVQTLAAEERRRRLKPPEGVVISLDYRTIEPCILLHYLITHFYLSLADVPQEDLYTAVWPEDRARGKQWLNTLINGGSIRETEGMTPFQRKLLMAVREFQQDQFAQLQQRGVVTTLGGRELPVPTEGSNRIGKMMSRLIQGSASDIFHTAIIRIQEMLEEHRWPIRIYFLLFDEVWLHGEGAVLSANISSIQEIMESVPRKLGMVIPIRVRQVTI